MTTIICNGRLQAHTMNSRNANKNARIRSQPQTHVSINKFSWKHSHGLHKYTPTTNLRTNPSKIPATSSTSESNQHPATAITAVTDAPVIVWFKHDLRIDDHPGLHQALATSKNIIPIFCFDPKRYEQVVHSPSSAAALHQAVTSLRSSLRSLGSDLIISCGSWEEELPILLSAAGAGAVITEGELEEQWKEGFEAASLAASLSIEKEKNISQVDFHTWTAPLFDQYTPEKFTEWKKQRTPSTARAPLDPPSSLPPLPSSVSSTFSKNNSSELPSPLEILQLVNDYTMATTDASIAELIRKQNTTTTASQMSLSSMDLEDEENNSRKTSSNGQKAADKVIEKLSSEPSTSETIAEVENSLFSSSLTNNNNSAGGDSWGAEIAAELAAGEGPVMEALNAYLRHVETIGDGGGTTWQWKLGSAISEFDIPAAPDGCFPALFNRAMSLGVVSRRRIYAEARELLDKDNAGNYMPPPPGILAKIGWLLTSSGGALVMQKRQRKATAAAAAAEAGDFHSGLARNQENDVHGGAKLKHWRWKGILSDYLVAYPEKPLPGAPAIVLVHGFGAFSEHWRDNVASLASQGFTVYAPTLVGYGRSEKPSIPYGQDVWRDCIADFVLKVVRQPVVISGNSIGGFIAASVAADYPNAVVGVVLVNSAGLLKENYAPPPTPPPPPSPPLFIVEGVSRALFGFLQGDVTNQLRRVYPVVPDRADAWLGGEIGRASADPGALGVFRSVFYLPKPRALNYLICEAFKGPVLVLQGAKDPLNDAVGRAKEIDRLCGNAQVVLLDAGHCPHDEKPKEFNEKFAAFVKEKFVNKREAATAGSR